MGRRIFQLLDSLVENWELVRWAIPGVAMLTAYLSGAWAWLYGESPPVITAVVFTMLTVTMIFFTYVPEFLKKRFQRPFAISVSSMLRQVEKFSDRVDLYVFILNRSPKNRVALDFVCYLRLPNGRESWSTRPTSGNIASGLGPEEHTAGTISFNMASVNDLMGNKDTPSNTYPPDGEMYLQVVDRISGRWARFRVPGSYPPDFFILK